MKVRLAKWRKNMKNLKIRFYKEKRDKFFISYYEKENKDLLVEFYPIVRRNYKPMFIKIEDYKKKEKKGWLNLENLEIDVELGIFEFRKEFLKEKNNIEDEKVNKSVDEAFAKLDDDAFDRLDDDAFDILDD